MKSNPIPTGGRSERIRRELDRIAREHGGVLMPQAVVDAARPKTSPLHSKFEWDDSEAAERYRLWQARQLINITVNVIGESGEKEQVYVSLKTDRKHRGGYRALVAVLSDEDMRAQLLQDAMEDMEVFQKKYRHLRELAEVFESMGRTRRRHRKAA